MKFSHFTSRCEHRLQRTQTPGSTLRAANVPWRRWLEKKDGVVLPLLALFFLLFFFLRDFYQFREGNVYHVYVKLIELICLPSVFTINCVLASLENVQQRRESEQSSRRVERSVRDSQESFQIKAGRVLASGASRKQLSHCGKKAERAPAFRFPLHIKNDFVIYDYFLFQSRGS